MIFKIWGGYILANAVVYILYMEGPLFGVVPAPIMMILMLGQLAIGGAMLMTKGRKTVKRLR